ncbi:MAG: ROK family glucokinase [Lachnospiraceae bacterium]|nr:ROK family glucokinase [Lachnospiraceae bacterium]
MNYCFGVDVGGTGIKLGLFDAGGTLLDQWEIKTHVENEGIAILPDIAKTIADKMIEKKICKEEIVGIGVGVPAPVTEEGIVNGSANLGWSYKEVKKELEALTGLSAVIGNDANVAALGEMWKGGGKSQKNMVMVTLGTGVGGGIIVGGRILIGAHGAGGEIGHLKVDYEELELCGCGKQGCLEQYTSATGIVRIGKQILHAEKAHTILDPEQLSAKSIFDAVKAGDEVAIKIAIKFGDYLGKGLSDIATLVDPAVFVIGGGVSKAGEVLLRYIEGPFREHAFFANVDAKFVLATLGNDAGIYGSAKMVLED